MNNNIFKETRLKKRLTIEHVSSILKINSKYIEYIEENNFKKISHRIFLYGYCIIYANFLKIPVEDIAYIYSTFNQNPQIKHIPRSTNKNKNHRSIYLYCFVLLLSGKIFIGIL